MHELIERWRREAAKFTRASSDEDTATATLYTELARSLDACADELERALRRNRAEIIAVTDSRANTWTRQEDGSWKATLAQPLVAGDTITIVPK